MPWEAKAHASVRRGAGLLRFTHRALKVQVAPGSGRGRRLRADRFRIALASSRRLGHQRPACTRRPGPCLRELWPRPFPPGLEYDVPSDHRRKGAGRRVLALVLRRCFGDRAPASRSWMPRVVGGSTRLPRMRQRCCPPTGVLARWNLHPASSGPRQVAAIVGVLHAVKQPSRRPGAARPGP